MLSKQSNRYLLVQTQLLFLLEIDQFFVGRKQTVI